MPSGRNILLLRLLVKLQWMVPQAREPVSNSIILSEKGNTPFVKRLVHKHHGSCAPYATLQGWRLIVSWPFLSSHEELNRRSKTPFPQTPRFLCTLPPHTYCLLSSHEELNISHKTGVRICFSAKPNHSFYWPTLLNQTQAKEFCTNQ